MNSHIKNIISREILDSRGNPTVEVDIILENNTMGRAAVPSGASTGEFEAMELRDNDKTRYIGKGVLTAVNNINDEINKALVGVDVIDQLNIEMEYGVNSISYLFIPESSNNKLIIYHQGHGGDFFKGEKTIQYFLEKNYSVLAFSMPLLGMNNQPVVDLPNMGKFELQKHAHFRFLDAKDFSSIKFFVEPRNMIFSYFICMDN